MHDHECSSESAFGTLPETKKMRGRCCEMTFAASLQSIASCIDSLPHSTCTCGINAYGPHNGLEVCAPKIDRSAHLYVRGRYSGYPVHCLAFPDSSIVEWTQMTESSSCSLLKCANRESKMAYHHSMQLLLVEDELEIQ